MAESSYLRYPHVARDLITFAAEDDVWLASLSEAAAGGGTQARRLTADRVPVHGGRHPYLGRRDRRYFNALADGTLVTQPASALWFPRIGWGMDNHGAEPDIEVAIPPHDWAAGRDPQLGTAVRLALPELEQRPPAAPPAI